MSSNQFAVPTRKLFLSVCAWLLMAGVAEADPSTSLQQDEQSIARVLDGFHHAAAQGDWAAYFDLMSDDAVFIGTDASERWPKAEFRAYAGTRSGWVYLVRSRNINLTPSRDSAWFDEILDSASYGTCRSTGVLIRTEDGWKISQYHLTFPIPNALAAKLTAEIRQFESELTH
jgi:ketosteroid isomerase-like protein